MASRWQVLKNGIPWQMCSTPEEADKVYMEIDADEIREIEDDDWNPVLAQLKWVKCCKCGAKLHKDIDTWRYNEDGKPVCYDCVNKS